MPTRPATQESSIETQRPSIKIATEAGRVSLEYGDQDTLFNLMERLQEIYGYPVHNQQFTVSSGIPGDPLQEIGQERLVRDFATGGVLRLNMTNASQPQSEVPGNSIKTATASDNAGIRAGDEWSVEAVRAVTNLPCVTNRIDNATARGSGMVKAGQVYGFEANRGNKNPKKEDEKKDEIVE